MNTCMHAAPTRACRHSLRRCVVLVVAGAGAHQGVWGLAQAQGGHNHLRCAALHAGLRAMDVATGQQRS
jgi:hypothetical protein